MPTYQYRCLDCSKKLEVVQKFTDDQLTQCPDCEGTLRKVFSAVGVVFKGSGFYATDNRPKSSTKANGSSESKESGGESSDSRPSGGDTKPNTSPKPTTSEPASSAKPVAGTPAA